MFSLCFQPTNLCNRSCRHCAWDKLEPRQSIPIELAEKILGEAKALGINRICLTGGEIALYPQFKELVQMMVRYGFNFNLVTNGFHFRETMLPPLTQPGVNQRIEEVCFSLDGARAESHDALRGKGSFKEVMEGALLCRLKGIPMGFKSTISNLNKGELTELALLGATLGAKSHGFIALIPAPRLVREQIIPAPDELEQIVSWIMNSLAPAVKTRIHIDAWSSQKVVFECGAFNTPNIDHQGNIEFCGGLSHVADDDKPAKYGRELLGNLNEISLSEGISRHFKLLAQLMQKRLQDGENLSTLTYIPCYWCFKYFGKLDWLKNYPESPWARGILNDQGRS